MIRRRDLLPLFVLVCLVHAGCTAGEKIKVTGSGTPTYDQLQVVYDVPSAAGLRSLGEPPAVRQVSGGSEADEAPPTKTRLRLELQYPYPGLHDAFARATLRVVTPESAAARSPQQWEGWAPWLPFSSSKEKAAAASTPGEIQGDKAAKPSGEALVLDLPKRELDALLYDLAKDGYFAKEGALKAKSRLALTYNKFPVEKDWSREPRLDALIEAIKKHGSPSAGG